MCRAPAYFSCQNLDVLLNLNIVEAVLVASPPEKPFPVGYFSDACKPTSTPRHGQVGVGGKLRGGEGVGGEGGGVSGLLESEAGKH